MAGRSYLSERILRKETAIPTAVGSLDGCRGANEFTYEGSPMRMNAAQ